MTGQIVGVGQLNLYIKELLGRDSLLGDIWVKGELSNYKAHSSGHHYFTMKDDVGSIRCVMFRAAAGSLVFRPASGMGVLVRGRVSVFERDGQYQLYVSEMQPDGIGAAQLALEQLKCELQEKGLLDASRKKAVPKFPKVIGVVTSSTGAAWQDIQKVAFSRYKGAHLLLYPASVQGETAPREISEAISLANRHAKADVLIVGRGGGSIEDLWCFNSREVAYAIAVSEIPVVSAVGHEIDFTVADLVADLRAATPSAAAEQVVPSAVELTAYLSHAKGRLGHVSNAYLERARRNYESLLSREVIAKPETWLLTNWQTVDNNMERLSSVMKAYLEDCHGKLLLSNRALDLLNPAGILLRGYSLTYDDKGHVLTSIANINAGNIMETRLADGVVCSTVTETTALSKSKKKRRVNNEKDK